MRQRLELRQSSAAFLGVSLSVLWKSARGLAHSKSRRQRARRQPSDAPGVMSFMNVA
jgi:hypothetical protein